MKILKQTELHLVNPKFRKMVQEAWVKGEEVPYSVIYLSEEEPNEKDIQRAKEIIKNN